MDEIVVNVVLTEDQADALAEMAKILPGPSSRTWRSPNVDQ
jgi:hypothetical protein